jgi:hypothetical protein
MKEATDYTVKVIISPLTVPVAPVGNVQQTIQSTLDIKIYNSSGADLFVKELGIILPETFSNNIVPAALQPEVWNIDGIDTPGAFVATPVSGEPNELSANGSIDFTLTADVLNQQSGIVNITVKIQFADGTTSLYYPTIQTVPVANSITVFNAQSPIYLGNASNLIWQTTGIDHCIITPPEDAPQVGANSNQNVEPEFTTTYTLSAYAAGVILVTEATVMVIRAHGELYNEAGLTSADYNGNIALTWNSNEFTKSIKITCTDSSVVIPAGLTNNDTATFGPITNLTSFELTCYGYEPYVPPYQVSIPVSVNPPVVTGFSASPNTGIWTQDAVTLSWTTTSAQSVVITSDAGDSWTSAGSSLTVNPVANVTYTIVAIGGIDSSGKPMQSAPFTPITLAVAQLDILTFVCNPQYIIPGTDPNQGSLFWVTEAPLNSIDNNIGTVHTTGNQIINAPADGTQYTLTSRTAQNSPSVQVQQPVVICNGFGPFQITGLSYDEPSNTTTVTLQSSMGLSKLVQEQPGVYFWVTLTGLANIDNATTAPGYFTDTQFIAGEELLWAAGQSSGSLIITRLSN